jgi:hypothetical protein
VAVQVFDCSPVRAVFDVFRPISQLQGFDFSPVTHIPGENFSRRQGASALPPACNQDEEIGLFRAKGAMDANVGAPIRNYWRSAAKFKMKKQGRIRDSSPRLPPFQWVREGKDGAKGESRTIATDKDA